jgi:hypothetical protein
MHYSQTHGYNADGTGTFAALGGDGPYEYLLRDDINALCLACHNNQGWAPDVLGPNTGAAIRQAGRLNEGGADYATGHSLGSDLVAPGSDPAWSNADGLTCVDCHHQHGYNPNGNAYRNLAGQPGNVAEPGLLVSYTTGTNDSLDTDVFQSAALAYDINDVWFNEPDETGSGYADWCKGCHTNFHGAKGGDEVGGLSGTEWTRHPGADADIGAFTSGHSSITKFAAQTNKVKVMHPLGIWESTDEVELAGSTPSCMSCHKAHGNQNAFGLIFMSGEGDVTEEGDDGTGARDLCGQCHVQVE